MIRAAATFEDNTLAEMVHLVEEAQERKVRRQAVIERAGRVYSPLVLAGAGGLLVIPYVSGLPIHVWATRAVVLLVAVAPCALAIWTRVAMTAGIGRAA